MSSSPHFPQSEIERILELHQAKAAAIFLLIKENYPDENLFTLQTSLLILLAPICENQALRSQMIKQIQLNLTIGE